MPTPVQLITIAAISALGGAVNSVAGGGMLLVFPALVGLGVPPIVANATGTVALWPGSMGSLWGYRTAMRGAGRWALHLAIPSLIGGLLGAWLLLSTPTARFSALVPWLVLGATVLFVVQRPVSDWLLRRSRAARAMRGGANVQANAQANGGEIVAQNSIPRPSPPWHFLVLQLAIAIYGGYFGAGAGILMLVGLGLMGLTVRALGEGKAGGPTLAFVLGLSAPLLALPSVLVVPMLAGIQLVGVLSVHAVAAEVFSDDDEEVLATMATHHVRRLPVLDKHRHLQGVLSIDDIVQVPRRRGTPTAEEIVDAFKGIGAPRAIETAIA